MDKFHQGTGRFPHLRKPKQLETESFEKEDPSLSRNHKKSIPEDGKSTE
jgi:hypothetical protein